MSNLTRMRNAGLAAQGQDYSFGDRFQSKWINVDDVGDRTFKLKIAAAEMAPVYSIEDDEEIEREVVRFAGAKKALVLNLTNYNVLVCAFGPNPADWIDKVVVLYVDWSVNNPSNASRPGGIKLRVEGTVEVMPPRQAPAPAQPAPAPSQGKESQGASFHDDLNDGIPFAPEWR